MNALRPDAGELAAALSERELLRLLGMPRGRELSAELRERAQAARSWYAANGRPFAVSQRVDVVGVGADEVELADGTRLHSVALASGLRAAHAHGVVVLAVSAGREVAAETARLWAAERPDEAYFLDRLAAGVAEALVPWAAGELCRQLTPSGEALLPPRSPGCGDFAIDDQQQLMRLLGGVPVPGPVATGPAAAEEPRLRLGPIELLPTCALDPPHSLLAALGVTRQPMPLAAPAPEDLCRACDLEPCLFRRAAFAASAGVVAAGEGR